MNDRKNEKRINKILNEWNWEWMKIRIKEIWMNENKNK